MVSPTSALVGKPIDVAAGLVFHQKKLLITRRPVGVHLAGLWEFPGGKREPSETFEECLSRELHEELGIDVAIGQLFDEITHDYPERTVRLRFFLCRLANGQPRAIGCAAFEWVTRDGLVEHKFPPADERLLRHLVDTGPLWR